MDTFRFHVCISGVFLDFGTATWEFMFANFGTRTSFFWHACLHVRFFKEFWGLYVDVWNMLHFRVGILVLEMSLDMLQQPAFHLC
jgi:hypothetical protein